jgi:hypothetical protein
MRRSYVYKVWYSRNGKSLEENFSKREKFRRGAEWAELAHVLAYAI